MTDPSTEPSGGVTIDMQEVVRRLSAKIGEQEAQIAMRDVAIESLQQELISLTNDKGEKE